METALPRQRPPREEEAGKPGTFLSHQVVGGIPWTVISKAVLFFAYFSISILLVRNLGAENYGVFSLCKNISEYLVVVCALGLNTAVVRFVPELLVSRNRAGLTRLLTKTAVLQMGMAVFIGLGLGAMKSYLDAWFHIEFSPLLLLFIALMVAAQLARDFIVDALTAVFQVRALSVLSIVHGLLWASLLATVLPLAPQVHVALSAQIASLSLLFAVGLVFLVSFLRRLDWRSPLLGIGRRRTLWISFSSLGNGLVNMLMKKYTEVFFLGVFSTPAVVGLYDLGYSVPLMVVTFLPLAIQKLFTSGFAEAYTRDEACLGRLVAFLHKTLILTMVPLAAFGVCFAPRAIALFYGTQMQEAGTIAAAFFVLHSLNLLYVPLSMAIIAKEKILQTLPVTLLQFAVKLVLDYLLIPAGGIYGAIAAVALSFFLTLPVQLWVVYRLVGGIYFPLGFLAKVTLPLGALAALLSRLSPQLNIPGLLGLGVAYLGACLLLIRLLRLIRREDVAELRELGLERLNKALDFLVGGGS